MDLNDYAKHLGGLVGNFHSLEFLLRNYLQKLPSARPLDLPKSDIYSCSVGNEVSENELTSYDSLGQLIAKYNTEMKRQNHLSRLLGLELVKVRDALAHGRVSAPEPSADRIRLLKFEKPKNGKVRVSFNEDLSEEWFINQKCQVMNAINKIKENIA